MKNYLQNIIDNGSDNDLSVYMGVNWDVRITFQHGTDEDGDYLRAESHEAGESTMLGRFYGPTLGDRRVAFLERMLFIATTGQLISALEKIGGEDAAARVVALWPMLTIHFDHDQLADTFNLKVSEDGSEVSM